LNKSCVRFNVRKGEKRYLFPFLKKVYNANGERRKGKRRRRKTSNYYR